MIDFTEANNSKCSAWFLLHLLNYAVKNTDQHCSAILLFGGHVIARLFI